MSKMSRPGHRIKPVTLYSSQQEIKSSFDQATKPWICRTCGEEFNLLESMGTLDCFQHPGYIQEDERWSCCGQRIHSMRWLPSRDIQRMYVSNCFAPSATKTKGCQACDHNTSDRPYMHKDQQSIASLSAILPFMNKEFPFVRRNGFDTGVLRRCAVRPLQIPPGCDKIIFQDNDGTIQERTTDEGYHGLMGMELAAYTINGTPINCWW